MYAQISEQKRKKGICIDLKYSPHKTYQYKVKDSNFTVEKPSRHQLNHVNITGNKTYQHPEPLAMMYNISFQAFLIKMHNLNPIIRKHDKPKMRDIEWS